MYKFKCVESETGNVLNPVHAMFLDFWNNFVSIEAFADHYHIDEQTAKGIIDSGRELHKLQNGE